ncbi:MAG: DEAD/DEAH box helicase, partial [Planctomycetes bacterium]|nr:DEAD/DEAH box helicase [Planctomycetota bacterium]
IKALSNQKYRDFKELLGQEVGIMTGDITLNPGAPLLIMTTEIFRNTIFEQPDRFSKVRYVVFDEIHFMDDPERGTVWEESIIFAPESMKFICLSATISNLKQFGLWMSKVRKEEMAVIRSSDRPVPLTHYLYLPGRGPARTDKVTQLPSRRQRRGSEGADDLIAFLKRYKKLPTLYFCFSRKECEKRARKGWRLNLLSSQERSKMDRLFNDIVDRYALAPDASLDELKALALEGVGFHHAGLLPQHKELVERLFTSGLIKLLFTTETFALGINMPARTVVFSSLIKFDGVGFDLMTTREYQQMAGRAGRQGIDSEGLVYAFIADTRLQLPDIRKLTSNDVEPVQSRFKLSYSSLINLHARLGKEIYSAWERSFNNFQWARMSRKKRENNRKRQMEQIGKRLTILRDLDYIDDAGLRPKGDVAALINGYELQSTELLFSGLLDWLDPVQINIIMASVVFEARRSDLYRRLDVKILGELKNDAQGCVDKIVAMERREGLRDTLHRPDFKIGSVVAAWCEGASMADLGQHTNAAPGDLVRTFRLTIQLLRQIRKAMPVNPPLAEKLKQCIVLLNRDEVDALRQLTV